MAFWDKRYLPSDLEGCFDDLTRTLYRVVQPHTNRYNCIAYAAGDETRWWWPDPYGEYYWPPEAVREQTVDAFEGMFRLFEYSDLVHPESCFLTERVAIYYDRVGSPPDTWAEMPTHGARQMMNRRWRSKLGQWHMIEHSTLECLNGRFPAYGEPIKILARPRFWLARLFWKLLKK
jgi:hypothetical protein